MAEDAGVEGRVTNKTSIRTTITRMSFANVPRIVISDYRTQECKFSYRYDDSLEVVYEIAMKTLEPIARDNDLQYSTIKNQVTKVFSQH